MKSSPESVAHPTSAFATDVRWAGLPGWLRRVAPAAENDRLRPVPLMALPLSPALRRRSWTVREPSSGLTVGMDLVEVAQVARSIERFGEAYLRRVFTSGELTYCLGMSSNPAPHLAARFAAKEATLKALRQGDEAVDWRSVDVQRRPDGSCHVFLQNAARALAERRGVDAFSVTMSHDGEYAAAVVVGERRHRPDAPTSRLLRTRPRGAYER
jgi:holo-[acyl-carrier protein] synthase